MLIDLEQGFAFEYVLEMIRGSRDLSVYLAVKKDNQSVAYKTFQELSAEYHC